MENKVLNQMFYDDFSDLLESHREEWSFQDYEDYKSDVVIDEFYEDNVKDVAFYGKDTTPHLFINGLDVGDVFELAPMFNRYTDKAYDDFMYDFQDVNRISDENGFKVVETTEQRNGYPSNLQDALLPSEYMSWDNISYLAKKYGLTPIKLSKKDGWQLWVREGSVNELFDVQYLRSEIDGHEQFNYGESIYDRDIIKNYVPNLYEDVDGLKSFADSMSELQSAIDNISETEFVDYDWNKRDYEVYDKESTVYYYDTNQYCIALIKFIKNIT